MEEKFQVFLQFFLLHPLASICFSCFNKVLVSCIALSPIPMAVESSVDILIFSRKATSRVKTTYNLEVVGIRRLMKHVFESRESFPSDSVIYLVFSPPCHHHFYTYFSVKLVWVMLCCWCFSTRRFTNLLVERSPKNISKASANIEWKLSTKKEKKIQ